MRTASGRRPERRRRQGEGPGLLAMLVGAVGLATLGLGAGMLAGVVLEEPGLVFAHLVGRSDEVLLDAAPTQQVSAAGDQMRETGPGDRPVRDARTTGSGVSSPKGGVRGSGALNLGTSPPGAGLAVQVGAFADAAAADGLAGRLRERGLPVYVSPETGGARWRVRVGPVPTRAEAERLAARLEREEHLPTWILEEDPQ